MGHQIASLEEAIMSSSILDALLTFMLNRNKMEIIEKNLHNNIESIKYLF